MKRSIFTIILFISIIFTLVSCTNTNEEEKIKIGVIDTSISPETAKKIKINNMSDFVNEEIEDDYTHGAVMLNIINDNSKKHDIYYATALDSTLTGEIDNVILSVDWCIKNNVDIICMSFATLKDDANLQQKVREATDIGIIVVASCINYSDLKCYPAMYNGVISVSEGANSDASIIISDMRFKVKIDGDTIEWEGCSALTAYVCGNIANELSKGNKDVFEILKGIKEN